MNKLQQLQLMDKILRELQDLENSQTSVLKKVAQIETHNITLDDTLLNDKLSDLHEEVSSSVEIVTELLEAFTARREKFYSENEKALQVDPTA
ncbi:MAG: hypothetical protein ABW007_25030 [Chitinophagaceae bacterium]